LPSTSGAIARLPVLPTLTAAPEIHLVSLVFKRFHPSESALAD
jgi:hypothetical protein